jgi:ABC-type phosphate transport system ATPase subunit
MKVGKLNFYYGAYQALHVISLEVAANRVTALIGTGAPWSL